MATTKGNHITDFDSNPPDTVNSRLHGGYIKGSIDTFELGILALNDDHQVFKLPIDAIIHSIKMATDDLGTTGALSIGFYEKKSDGTFALIDVDAIASAVDVSTAAVALTEFRFEAADIDTGSQRAFELAGLTTRPLFGDIYIALTASTATTAAGTVHMAIEYSE